VENLADAGTWILMGQVTLKLLKLWWPLPVAATLFILIFDGGQ